MLVACAAVGGVFLLTSRHVARKPRVTATSAHGHPGIACASPGCGSYAATPTFHVGAPTPSSVTCTRTLYPGADVESVLSSASPGSVVCLSSGRWSATTLTSIAPASPGVTLAATPGQTVVVPGITVNGSNTKNLTIEGFNITQPGTGDNGIELLCNISGGVRLEYNTIEDQPNGVGIYSYPDNCGSGHRQFGVVVAYNQIDHVATGLQINGNDTEQFNWTISHNVIGPEIQYRGYGHYIEIGGVTRATINNNAFEGPPDPEYENPTSHLNVLHVDGGQSDVTFTDNIMWETDVRAQTVLVEDTPMDNIAIENNLDVEDSACEADANCYTHPVEVDAPHGLTFEHNTFIYGTLGMLLGRVVGTSYRDPRNMIAEYNIAAPATRAGGGEQNYDVWDCVSSCAAHDNTSADSSASMVLGGTGNVINWTPSWANTNWTPVNGPGYQPPPSNYYKPVGLSISAAGYQGYIGP